MKVTLSVQRELGGVDTKYWSESSMEIEKLDEEYIYLSVYPEKYRIKRDLIKLIANL